MNEHIQRLAERLRSNLDCENPRLHLQLLQQLADGEPVSVRQLSERLDMPAEAVADTLRADQNIEYNPTGNVIGIGLTLEETPHRFLVRGRTLFTWCALDTLAFPPVLNEIVQVESRCPTTGAALRLTVTPGGVPHYTPAGMVMSLVVPEHEAACSNIRGSFCNHSLFFSSREAAEAWQAQHPEGHIVSIEEAFELGRVLAETCCMEG